MNEENKSYNILSKLIHWVTALLILGLLFVGFYMDSLDTSDYKYWLYAQHKSLGVLVIALTVARILWHIIKRKPKHLSSHKKWEKVISSLTHMFLYMALFAVPLSGWAMSSAGGYTVSFFGLFDLPALVQKDKAMFDLAGDIHEISAFAVFFLIGLHMLGAFKHHFIDKDDTLKRMTTKALGLVGGIIVLFLAVAAYAPAGFYVAEEVIEEISEDDGDDEEKDHDDDDHGH